ncbi:MAG: hypothetical protein C4523_11170 [Myxococcales bacterium]|nr:MAG: hypothetical protein C4523_11170 [Myxococcales bacterium]
MKTRFGFLVAAAVFIALPLYAQDFDSTEEDQPPKADIFDESDRDLYADPAPTEAEKEAAPSPPSEEAPLFDEPNATTEDTVKAAGEQEEKDKKFRFSDFIDTKINIAYADDNLLENNEFSPAMGIGQRNVSEFVGNAGEVRPVDINHTHLVLHHKSDGYLPGVLTEAALVIRFKLATDAMSGQPQPSVGDDGTFLRAGYIFDHKTAKKTLIDLTGFPFDAERFLLGYHYDLTWGGMASFPQNRDPVPGLRIGFEHPRFYVFAGFKTHLQPKKDKLNTERVPVETVYAGLFGAGVTIIKGLMLEANGGVIQKGDNPNMPEVEDNAKRDDILAWGVSSRLSYARGLKIGDRMDLRLYQNDPRHQLEFARPDEYEAGKFSFMVSAEGDFLQENLQDPDSTGGTKPFQAPAALIAAKFKYDYARFHVEGSYRSLEFLLFDTPGFVPFQALPKTARTRPELAGVVAVDYHIKPAYLTLGLALGYKRPATYQGAIGVPIAVVKRRTASTAYISPFNRPIEILPADKDAFDIIETKFDLAFHLSDFMTFLFEMSYTLDNNRVKLVTSEENSEELRKDFEDSSIRNRLGLAAVVQAKF